MDFTDDFAMMQKSISQALVETTRSATHASAQDTAFYRSVDPGLGRDLDRQSYRLLSLTQRLLRRCTTSSDLKSFQLTDVESIDTNWRTMVDITDGLLERTDACLDEYNGLIKRASPHEHVPSPASSSRTSRPKAQFRFQNMPKPQIHFDVPPTNDEIEPFRPILSSKPHATVPIAQSCAMAPNELGKPQRQHPYAPEIGGYNYPSFVYTEEEPQPYLPFETTTADFVDTMEGVHQMLEELKRAPVLAIDLEHHDAHSYVGIVSLMQISTRDHDWIVDTLKPWRRKLEVLNEVFADPCVLKVFHGAHMDIMWLQRDFGLYVVGLFDTHHASRVLGYSGGSLAFLLKNFINFDAQKQYQTADWRIRPLPREMFEYARSDTHFLLYIYDCMRNELITRSALNAPSENMMNQVLERSKETALQRYEHSIYDERRGLGRGGWFGLLQKTPALLSKEQFAVFRKVHQWRDSIARQEDESPMQVMPNHTIFNVARTLPYDVPALLSVLHPISQTVRSRTNALLDVVRQAIIGAPDEADMNETLSCIADEIGTAPLIGPLEPKATYSEKPTAEVPLAANRNLAGNFRADHSSFWGLTLPKHNEALGASLPVFEATPRFSNGNVDPSIAVASGTDIDQDTSPSNSENAQDFVIGKEQDILTKPTSSKRKVDNMAARDVVLQRQIDDPTMMTTEALQADTGRVIQKMHRRANPKAAKQAPIRSDPTSSKLHISADKPNRASDHFDYNAAPSVLNAEKNRSAKQRDPTEGQAPYNLYAKSTSGNSNAKQVRNAKAGKSATYR